MATQLVEKDLLAHINPEGSLYQQSKLTSGCVTIFNELGAKLELCWDIDGNEVCVKLKLSAFGQSKDLGNACLTIGQSTKIGGHIDSLAKAEVSISAESGPKICFDGKVCVKPFIGGWHCASTGKHCINV